MSKHITKKAATKRAAKMNTDKPTGNERDRSSGWSRFDYSVRKVGGLLRRYEVYVR